MTSPFLCNSKILKLYIQVRGGGERGGQNTQFICYQFYNFIWRLILTAMIWDDSVINCWPWGICRNIYLYTNIGIFQCHKNENRDFDFERFEMQFWFYFLTEPWARLKKFKIGLKNLEWNKKPFFHFYDLRRNPDTNIYVV